MRILLFLVAALLLSGCSLLEVETRSADSRLLTAEEAVKFDGQEVVKKLAEANFRPYEANLTPEGKLVSVMFVLCEPQEDRHDCVVRAETLGGQLPVIRWIKLEVTESLEPTGAFWAVAASIEDNDYRSNEVTCNPARPYEFVLANLGIDAVNKALGSFVEDGKMDRQTPRSIDGVEWQCA